jgi:hypothetical protein
MTQQTQFFNAWDVTYTTRNSKEVVRIRRPHEEGFDEVRQFAESLCNDVRELKGRKVANICFVSYHEPRRNLTPPLVRVEGEACEEAKRIALEIEALAAGMRASAEYLASAASSVRKHGTERPGDMRRVINRARMALADLMRDL